MNAYCVWPPNLYLAGLQDQLLEASRSLQVNQVGLLYVLTWGIIKFMFFANQKYHLKANKTNFMCFYLKFWSWTSWRSYVPITKLWEGAKFWKKKNVRTKIDTISRSLRFYFFKILPPLKVWLLEHSLLKIKTTFFSPVTDLQNVITHLKIYVESKFKWIFITSLQYL